MELIIPEAVGKRRGWLIAGYRTCRSSLDDDSPDALEVNKSFEFFAIPKGAAGSNDRVLQTNPGELRRQIRRLAHIGLSEFSI
jgi:hypothetical protein